MGEYLLSQNKPIFVIFVIYFTVHTFVKMDLISTVYGPKRNDTKLGNIPFPSKWFHESSCKCDVSGRNTLAFVSAHPLTQACSVPNEEDDHPLLLPLHQKGKYGLDKLSFTD